MFLLDLKTQYYKKENKRWKMTGARRANQREYKWQEYKRIKTLILVVVCESVYLWIPSLLASRLLL